MSLPERLKSERKRLKLTQAELAKKLGLGRVTYIHYESGSRSPNADTLVNLESVGINSWFVLTGEIRHRETIFDMKAMEKAVELVSKLVYELNAAPNAEVMTEVLLNSYRANIKR